MKEWDKGALPPLFINIRLGVAKDAMDEMSAPRIKNVQYIATHEGKDIIKSKDVFVSVTFSDITENTIGSEAYPTQKVLNGGFTLQDDLKGLLDQVKGLEKKPKKILIPLTQNCPYALGWMRRAHFTMLEINVDDRGEAVSATHIDSKGMQSSAYVLSHIQEALEHAKSGLGNTMQSIYLGHQGLTDNVNCGRFVIAYCHLVAAHPDKPLSSYTAEEVQRTYQGVVDMPLHSQAQVTEKEGWEVVNKHQSRILSAQTSTNHRKC